MLIEEVRRSFVATLPGLLESLSSAVRAAASGEPNTCGPARDMAHRLAGSGGTFGLGALSAEARELESLLGNPESCSDWKYEVDVALRRVLDAARSPTDLLRSILPQQQAEAVHHGRAVSKSPVPPSRPNSSRYPQPYGRWTSLPVMLVLEPSAARTAIHGMLQQFGFMVVATDKATKFPITPLAFLCSLDKAADVRKLYPRGDIIAVTDSPGFEARLSAVRMGCRATVPADVDAPELAAAMDRLVPLELETPRVLIVDDDPYVSQRTAIVLEQAGLEVTILTDPVKLLEHVAETRPHLVIMDMRLPNCTGLELAAVLRQDDRMVGVPIVFLTAEDRPARALEALEVGADDFLVKPVDSNRLVSVVLSRLERSRVLRAFMDYDSLTRLLSHARTLERLESEVMGALRRGEPLSLGILDLDHFKQVNDRFGHATGDRVLRSLSTVLRRRARRTDVFGRCGGEEFVAILPGANGADASRLINERREMFASLHYTTPSGPMSCTFSAGVAQLEAGDTPALLWERADCGLYEAKRAGRNCVKWSKGSSVEGKS